MHQNIGIVSCGVEIPRKDNDGEMREKLLIFFYHKLPLLNTTERSRYLKYNKFRQVYYSMLFDFDEYTPFVQ